MRTETMKMTNNVAVKADTCNAEKCSAPSALCRRICYGKKMKGLSYIGRLFSLVIAASARMKGYLRPFTISGDIPGNAREFSTFRNAMVRASKMYRSTWIPTRIWSRDGGDAKIAALLTSIPNLHIMLSFDGSMDLHRLRRSADALRGRFGHRVQASTIMDPPADVISDLGPAYDADMVRRLVSHGAYACHKTYREEGSCDKTCGRACWGERDLPSNELIGAPLIMFKYHR